jgi:uncharacterized paraquat-inducible protein A
MVNNSKLFGEMKKYRGIDEKNYYKNLLKDVIKEMTKNEDDTKEIRCPVCSEINNRNDKYCKNCGAKIKYSFLDFLGRRDKVEI